MKKYLVKRTYEYSTQEWVEAESERDAKNTPPGDNDERNYDDFWKDSEVIDQEDEE